MKKTNCSHSSLEYFEFQRRPSITAYSKMPNFEHGFRGEVFKRDLVTLPFRVWGQKSGNMYNDWMSKNSGAKFGGSHRRRFYASWENLRWMDGYPTQDSVRANEGLQCAKPQPQRSVSASLLIWCFTAHPSSLSWLKEVRKRSFFHWLCTYLCWRAIHASYAKWVALFWICYLLWAVVYGISSLRPVAVVISYVVN